MQSESIRRSIQPTDAVPTLLGVLQTPGIQRIFVHDYAAVDVPSLRYSPESMIDRYAERALVMAQRGDIVVVLDPVDANYLSYLDALGVGPGTDGVVALNTVPSSSGSPLRSGALMTRLALDNTAIAQVAEHVDRNRTSKLNPYFASQTMPSVHRNLQLQLGYEVIVEAGSVSAANLANRKDAVRSAAQMLRVPTADGEVCSWGSSDSACGAPRHALMQAIARHRGSTGSVMIRGAWSMHGVDNLVVADGQVDVDGLQSWLAQRKHLRSFLVETLVPLVASPNLQLWISDDGASVEHLATTNQRLDAASAYRGSESPHTTKLAADLTSSAMSLGRWLSSIDYRGPLGIDFIETIDRNSGKRTHLLAEVNGRINGATYALALTERINQIRTTSLQSSTLAWITNTDFTVRARGFGELCDTLGDLLYTHASPSGVVPFNCGLLPWGHVHVAILAATVEDAQTLERELIARVSAA